MFLIVRVHYYIEKDNFSNGGMFQDSTINIY